MTVITLWETLWRFLSLHLSIDKSFLTNLAEVIGKYNAIIDVKKTDPSLWIEFEAK